MTKVTVRDLRTRFPRVRSQVERDGEVVITLRGKAIMVLRPVNSPAAKPGRAPDYFARLNSYQPRPLSRSAARALHEANRGER